MGRSPAKRTRQGLDGMASFIALCTFCEYHGPSVIISTQTLETPTSDEVVTADNGAVFIDCIRKLKRYQSDEEDFDTNKIRIGRTSRLSRRFSLPDGRNSVRSVCSYCSSLDAGLKALVSHGAQASFVSTQVLLTFLSIRWLFSFTLYFHQLRKWKTIPKWYDWHITPYSLNF